MIYHWTNKEKAATAIKQNRLVARKWQHFLEKEQRFARGSSWSFCPKQWQGDNEVCLVIDETLIENRQHHLNGLRTYLLTQGMTKPNWDPNAYKYEPTTVDEVFIEGTVDLSKCLLEVRILTPEAHSHIEKVSGKQLHWVSGLSCKILQT